MKIGLFDSGLGAMVVLASFQKYFPSEEFVFEMDREHAPYGEKTQEEIRLLTKNGVEKLFNQSVDVVILACNTATVHALRYLQQEVFPGKHILGVTIPGAEKVVEMNYKKIGVLATAATVKIRGYKDRVHILDESVMVEEVACAGLVPLIEQGIVEGEQIERLLEGYLSAFSSDIDALVLGCTHYPLIRESVEKTWKKVWGEKLPDIIDPGEESAKRFIDWVERKGLPYSKAEVR